MSPTPDNNQEYGELEAMLSETATSYQFSIPADPNSSSPSRWNEMRVITNSPTDLVRNTGVLVNTGGYEPHFLNSIEGLQYEVRVETVARVKPKQLAKYMADMQSKARRSSFSYVEGGHIVSIFAKYNGEKITSWQEFADVCGLVVGNSTKISKRLKEIIRLSRFFGRFDDLEYRLFENDRPTLTQEDVDGNSGIRKSFAMKLAQNDQMRKAIASGKIRRVIFRAIGPEGLIKGDAEIVPDKNIPSDIYTSVHNIKSELRTKHGWVVTIEPHHAPSPAWTNMQILSWFGGIFPLDQLKFATRSFLVETFNNLKAGKYPSHLVSLPKVKDGVDQIALFRLSAHKWLAHGMELNQTAALVKQAGTAVTKQLLSEPRIVTRNGRPWRDYTRQEVHVPIVHSTYAHFLTEEVVELLGYKIPRSKRGKLWYHEATHSVVIPGKHFREYYRNHGGWDLDDSAMVIVRYIDGELKAIIVRSPNSWGEYSIIDVDTNGLPLYFEYGDIPHVNSEDLPTMIQDLDIEDPEKDRSLPAGTFVRGEEYGYDDFDYALECAVINPGTGAAINLLCIAYNSIFGTYNRNPIADTEDVVDTTQQNPSLEGLWALITYLEAAKDELLGALLSGQPVDRLIFETRLNLSDEDKANLRGSVKLVDGQFSLLKQMVLAEIKEYSTKLEAMAIANRQELDFSGVDFSSVRGTETSIWDGFRAVATTARRIVLPQEQRELWQGYNRQLAAKLMRTPEDRRDKVLLNYLNWCYQEGKNDSALFGTPAVIDGVIEQSVLDLLLEALVRQGIAVRPE